MNTYNRLFSINRVSPSRTHMRDYDLFLLCLVGALIMLSLVMVYSASIALPENSRYLGSGTYSFIVRQAIFVILGLLAARVAYFINMDDWERFTPYLFAFSFLTLVLVLVPFIGKQVNGAYRWIPLKFFNFQPSEFMKIGILLFTASYVVRKQKEMVSLLSGFLPIGLIIVATAILLLLEPDLGATVVVTSISFGILFLGGIHLRIFIVMILLALLGIIGMVLLTPWRLKRLMAFLEPFSPEYAHSTGYQLTHSLIAIGRGEWFGVGLGSSIEKLHYLPEAHTDFILAVIGEELGFVGIVGVLCLFALIVWKSFRIGRQAIVMDREFSGLVAQGIGVWLGVQSLINLGVCLGLLPTKGLTLPMVSYGGSAMVFNLFAIGLLFRIDFENRQMMRGRPIRHTPKDESA